MFSCTFTSKSQVYSISNFTLEILGYVPNLVRVPSSNFKINLSCKKPKSCRINTLCLIKKLIVLSVIPRKIIDEMFVFETTISRY